MITSPEVKQKLFWQWCKTMFVCMICFCGAAFAIMTFNNDVSVTSVFGEVYRLITGRESEWAHDAGSCLILWDWLWGSLHFFNHFAKWKISADPTPLEVEMRLYEDNICKTVIQNDSRKERGIDVS